MIWLHMPASGCFIWYGNSMSQTTILQWCVDGCGALLVHPSYRMQRSTRPKCLHWMYLACFTCWKESAHLEIIWNHLKSSEYIKCVWPQRNEPWRFKGFADVQLGEFVAIAKPMAMRRYSVSSSPWLRERIPMWSLPQWDKWSSPRALEGTWFLNADCIGIG